MPERNNSVTGSSLGKLMRLRISVSAAEEYLGSYFYELMEVCQQVFRCAGEELTREQREEFQKWNPGVDWVGEGVRRRRGRALVGEGGHRARGQRGSRGLRGSLIIIFIIFILGVPLPLLSFGRRWVLVCRGEARFKNTNKQTCLGFTVFLNKQCYPQNAVRHNHKILYILHFYFFYFL